MKIRTAAILVTVLLLAGCANLKAYPVCQYNGPATTEDWKVFESSLKKALALSALGKEKRALITDDHRFALIKLRPYSHRHLSKAWSKLGCVGTYSSLSEERKLSACIKYLRTVMREDTEWQTEDDVLLFCSEADSCTAEENAKADAMIFCNGT